MAPDLPEDFRDTITKFEDFQQEIFTIADSPEEEEEAEWDSSL